MTIDHTQPIPLYFQLKTYLLEEIISGAYGPEERLPTEHELCERFGVSRTPVTRALTELADEGVIIRYRRRGSFVNPHWLTKRSPGPEVRMVLPDGPWESLVRAAVPPDTKLSIATFPLEGLLDSVRRAVGEGRAPDVALVDSVWVPELAAAGSLWPVEELDADWFSSTLADGYVGQLGSVNVFQEQTYAVQAEADVAGMWIRRDYLAAVDGTIPATWQELEQLAGEMAAIPNGPRHAVVFPGGSRGGETTAFSLLALLASNGVQVIHDDAVVLDDRRAVATLRFLLGLLERELVPPDVVTYEWDRPIRLVASGGAAISFGGSYEGRTLAALTGIPLERLTDLFSFAAIPAGPEGSPASLAGGMAYVIFRQAHAPKDAMRLLEHLLSHDALLAMVRDTGQMPPLRSAAEAVGEAIPFLADVTTMLQHALVRPAIPAHARVSRQLQAMLEGVLTGRFGPAAAVERTAELIAAITGLEIVH
jgi:multiple sugar transport system substrate-binding protein